MTLPSDHRLEELFVRYWDDTLTASEAAELERRLATDPEAMECFKALCLQATAAADFLGALPGAEDRPVLQMPPPRRRQWSRRQVLHTLGWGGAAACLAAGFFGWRAWAERQTLAQLAAIRGTVLLHSASGKLLSLNERVPPGGSVSTRGPDSSVVVRYPNGSEFALIGDATVSVSEDNRRLWLRQGTLSADIPPLSGESGLFSLATTEATITSLSGVVLNVGRVLRGTEIGVEQGWVKVVATAGSSEAVVRPGEVLTVQPEGNCRKQVMPPTPDEFEWDLSQPLPHGWHVGQRLETKDGPVVVPEYWFDPYHQTEMFQIRSDHQWTRGFVRLFPDSVFRVQFWVDQPGAGQLCLCARTPRTSDPATGMLECNEAFMRARPREWQWLEVPAGAMLSNMHAPAFGPPWVAFLIIFNTYKTDLGLKVAEFRVARSGEPEQGV